MVAMGWGREYSEGRWHGPNDAELFGATGSKAKFLNYVTLYAMSDWACSAFFPSLHGSQLCARASASNTCKVSEHAMGYSVENRIEIF
jgi:hypothetical protein